MDGAGNLELRSSRLRSAIDSVALGKFLQPPLGPLSEWKDNSALKRVGKSHAWTLQSHFDNAVVGWVGLMAA